MTCPEPQRSCRPPAASIPGPSSAARYRPPCRGSGLAEPPHRPRTPALDNNGRAAGLRAARLRHPRIHHRNRAALPAPSAPGDAGTEPPPLRAAPGTLGSPRAPAAPLGGRGPPETWRGGAGGPRSPQLHPAQLPSLLFLPPSLPPAGAERRPPPGPAVTSGAAGRGPGLHRGSIAASAAPCSAPGSRAGGAEQRAAAAAEINF